MEFNFFFVVLFDAMLNGVATYKSFWNFYIFPLVFQRSNRVKRFKTQRNLKYDKNSLHYEFFTIYFPFSIHPSHGLIYPRLFCGFT